MFTGLLKTRAHSKRHYVLVMAFAVVLVVGIGVYFLLPSIHSYFYPKTAAPTSDSEEAAKEVKYVRSAPIRLEIPSIKLDTEFVQPLGLLPDQTVSVPDSYTKVGWYSGGVSPGEVGSSVILGHVDSVAGPAIFYTLGQVKSGDEVSVTREDGTVAKFVVTKTERHPQSNFPTLDVYGPTIVSTLRLVTCSGSFNKGSQRYSHNLVVFAELVQG